MAPEVGGSATMTSGYSGTTTGPPALAVEAEMAMSEARAEVRNFFILMSYSLTGYSYLKVYPHDSSRRDRNT